MIHGRSKIRQEWFCVGCGKMHSVYQRDIEGVSATGKWCAVAIRKGIKERRNDLPSYDLSFAA